MAGGGVIFNGVKPNIQLSGCGKPIGEVYLTNTIVDDIYLLSAVAPRLFRLVDNDTVDELMDDGGRQLLYFCSVAAHRGEEFIDTVCRFFLPCNLFFQSVMRPD